MFGLQQLKRDFTVNHAELDAEAEDPSLRPVSLPEAPCKVADQIESWAGTESRWNVESRKEANDEIHLHLTHTTRILRFVDDIRVRLVGEGEHTRVQAESQSRIGKGDLGQNPRNLKRLTEVLRESR